jgi:hypothetical protein
VGRVPASDDDGELPVGLETARRQCFARLSALLVAVLIEDLVITGACSRAGICVPMLALSRQLEPAIAKLAVQLEAKIGGATKTVVADERALQALYDEASRVLLLIKYCSFEK